MHIDQVFENNKKWVTNKLNIDSNYFINLAKGQSPEILYIGCSDSRASAELLMGLEPGDLFVHRNIANQINADDLNSMSVLNYAVEHLKVNHIVVCGHSSCGGIQAALSDEDLGPLNPWIQNIKSTYENNSTQFKALNENESIEKLVELNVLKQCENISAIEYVKSAITQRNLKIHPWVFDIKTGHLIDLLSKNN